MTENGIRTYGNWRKPSSPGIYGFGLAGTVLLFGGVLLVIILLFVSLWVAFAAFVVVGLTLLPLLIRDTHGRNGFQWLLTRIAWTAGVARGHHLYRSGTLGRGTPDTCRLPGLASGIQLREFEDAHGRPFGLLTHRATWQQTVVLNCHADGASLVDAEQVDTWVAYWGDWLAQLAHEPGLVGASVTVESAPDTGERLKREVSSRITEEAPALARQVLDEIVRNYPVGSAQLWTRVALTFSGVARNTGKRRKLEDIAQSIGTRLPALATELQMTGAGPALAMSARQLTTMVRLAFDPGASDVADLGNPDGGLESEWDEVGPVATMETPTSYRHDSAWSVTWSMSDAPRGEVFSTVLNRLVAPHPDIFRKRVTLAYRPHDPGDSARLVERDRKDAMFKAKQAKVPQARDSIAVQAADLAAREEATGAGLVRFALYVTATVVDPDDLNLAASTIDSLASSSRIRLRRAHCAQASSFLAGLPLGIVMPLRLNLPPGLRDAL